MSVCAAFCWWYRAFVHSSTKMTDSVLFFIMHNTFVNVFKTKYFSISNVRSFFVEYIDPSDGLVAVTAMDPGWCITSYLQLSLFLVFPPFSTPLKPAYEISVFHGPSRAFFIYRWCLFYHSFSPVRPNQFQDIPRPSILQRPTLLPYIISSCLPKTIVRPIRFRKYFCQRYENFITPSREYQFSIEYKNTHKHDTPPWRQLPEEAGSIGEINNFTDYIRWENKNSYILFLLSSSRKHVLCFITSFHNVRMSFFFLTHQKCYSFITPSWDQIKIR